ncbi:MAG: cupin domain-containing protein [Thaumarchaeota archaeon]|nr:cupin domain-containing protein [Nitrososphaerota archaeon]MDE1867598.1 cupin domain-containing protein [Nitrososphaerota archaeon]
MKKENYDRIKLDKSLLAEKRRYFLGNVVLHDISKNIGIKDSKVYYAGFKNGARTKVHYHEGGQTLVVTQGLGVLVLFKGKIQGKSVRIKQGARHVLKTGDIVYIPKNTLHWHGAIENKNFGHVAFNAFSGKGKESKTIWYDSDFKTRAIKIL